MARASYAAYFAGVATLFLQSMVRPTGAPFDTRFWLLTADSVLTVLLGWLVGRGSRVSAAALTVQCVFAGWRYWHAGHAIHASVTLALFGGLYWLGFTATFELARVRAALAKIRDAVA